MLPPVEPLSVVPPVVEPLVLPPVVVPPVSEPVEESLESYVAVVAGGDGLHDVAVAVVAGDVDGGVLQLLLDVGVRGEDHATGGDEGAGDLIDAVGGGRTDAEAHGAESGDCYGVAFGGPRLDDFAGSIPACLHHALADARAEGSLLDDLALGELAVEVGTEHIGPLLGILVERHIAFNSFQLNCHKM